MRLFSKARARPEVFCTEDFFNCGTAEGTQILRYTRPSIERSGVVATFSGGLLTAKHVVEGSRGVKIPGFKAYPGSWQMDIAYRDDEAFDGPPLGWTSNYALEGVKLVTTSLEEPSKVVTIPGSLSYFDRPTVLQTFIPDNPRAAKPYLKPGTSGSPLLYNGYIIGVTPFGVEGTDKFGVLVFNGEYMRNDMQAFGLNLTEIKDRNE